ncbi:VOC family protein [Desertivirga brevis]|uniref:VOC family protein n=1 Tax=Desertivirga brevis TaxID=2810310 RepID=UPI001A97922B|nr:VOC family protein [Pedobacter sp. SYSU D00873]
MIKEVWLNLPVKDVKKAREFYTKIGFEQNMRFPETAEMSCVTIGSKNIVLMLCAEHVFESFTQHPVSDPKTSSAVLFSIDTETFEEIDGLAEKVKSAGGTVYAAPSESQGWMYGCGFTDLDGHRWNALYMDMSKMPKG